MRPPVVVGIDVGKFELEVAVSGASPTWTETTDRTGLVRLVAQVSATAPTLVVLEASGGYETPVLRELWAAELPTRCLNARVVRDFARATGTLAKTDRLDARVLVHYGEVMAPAPQAPPSPVRQQLAAWQARRHALQQVRVAEQNRGQQTDDPAIQASIAAVLAVCDAQIAAFEQRMDTLIAAEADLQAQAWLVQSVPGLAKQSARTLLAHLPELGQASPREIAALAGVAPFNRDSGRFQGERAIRGGRAALRRELYMPLVACIEHNPVISRFYGRLVARGKPHLVALTAAMRKLLVIVNAMLRDGLTWQELELTQA